MAVQLRFAEIGDIVARLDGATKGPWKGFDTGILSGAVWVVSNVPREDGKIMRKADADFIAAARDDVPSLLGIVEQLASALVRLEWHDHDEDWGDECPWCGAYRKNEDGRCYRRMTSTGHGVLDERSLRPPGPCPIDAALTAAGLDTREKRDALRRKLEGDVK